jgi:hypothetical protein
MILLDLYSKSGPVLRKGVPEPFHGGYEG